MIDYLWAAKSLWDCVLSSLIFYLTLVFFLHSGMLMMLSSFSSSKAVAMLRGLDGNSSGQYAVPTTPS